MEKIKIDSINKNKTNIEIAFSVTEGLRKYFNEYVFKLEYNEEISSTPNSLAILPFVCNVLPIIWITDSHLEVEEIDQDFFSGYSDILKGYQDMYPNISFKGKLSVRKQIINSNTSSLDSHTAAFFSGGVDAFATLIGHVNEKPALITLWGSDIALDDNEGWQIVKNHVIETCSNFGLQNVFIKSNFRTFINYIRLNKLVEKSGDSWWHGFQHGIGLIGHAAPIVRNHNLNKLYIASSYTEKSRGKLTCASDPTIDNNVIMAGCKTIHDQYEYERIQKVGHIVNYIKHTDTPVNLRVCYVSRGGQNCCKCEKCLRTMFEIFAYDEDPRKYGFDYTIKDLKNAKKTVLLNYNFTMKPLWEEIQTELIHNSDNNIPKEIEWVRTIDFEKERKKISFKTYALWKYMSNLPCRAFQKIKKISKQTDK